MHTLLQLHILGGRLEIIAGGMAFAATKGGALHRKIGIVLVYSMLVLVISASILAFDKGGFTHPNFLGGFMAAYFAIAALTTVRARSVWLRRLDVAAEVLQTHPNGNPKIASTVLLAHRSKAWTFKSLGTVANLR